MVRSPLSEDGIISLAQASVLSAVMAFSSQYAMPISRYIVVAVVRCSCAG